MMLMSTAVPVQMRNVAYEGCSPPGPRCCPHRAPSVPSCFLPTLDALRSLCPPCYSPTPPRRTDTIDSAVFSCKPPVWHVWRWRRRRVLAGDSDTQLVTGPTETQPTSRLSKSSLRRAGYHFNETPLLMPVKFQSDNRLTSLNFG